MKNSVFSKMAADPGISLSCFLEVEQSKMACIWMTIDITCNWNQLVCTIKYSKSNGSCLVSWLSFLIHFIEMGELIRTTTEHGGEH